MVKKRNHMVQLGLPRLGIHDMGLVDCRGLHHDGGPSSGRDEFFNANCWRIVSTYLLPSFQPSVSRCQPLTDTFAFL